MCVWVTPPVGPAPYGRLLTLSHTRGQARVRTVQQRIRGDDREWHMESKEAQGDGGGSTHRVEGTEAPDWGTAVAAPRHEARRASMGACGKRARGTRKARHPHAGRAPTTVITRLSRVVPRLTGGGHRPLGVGGPTRRGGDATNSTPFVCVVVGRGSESTTERDSVAVRSRLGLRNG